MPVFEWRSMMPAPVEELFAYHTRPGAFERLAPPWQHVRVLEQSGGMKDGGRLVFEAAFGPLKRRWEAELGGYIEGRQFVDRQVRGPLAAWEHAHRFLPVDERSSLLLDHVEYRLPAASLSDAIAAGAVGRQIARLFRFRHARTRMDLERHLAWADEPRLRVLISGASGLVGSSLTHYLSTAGHEVIRLVRRSAAGLGEVSWDPAAGRLDPHDLSGVDAVVNLAGASIASLWTPDRRKAIFESRLQATTTLVDAMRRMETPPPKVLVSASAVGAYGSRGGEALTEGSALGEDFLAEVCRAWEAAAGRAAELGVRVVTPRFGIVMSAAGGALAKMLPAFRAGLGARLGDGEQWWSWVDLEDLLAAVEWALYDGELSGAVNVTSPEPVRNRDFTRILGHVLRRPAALAVPRLAVSRGLGGMGREMFLASQRAVPIRLEMQGFRLNFADLEDALRFELGKQ